MAAVNIHCALWQLKKEEIDAFCLHYCTFYKFAEHSYQLLQVKNDG
jgi:hypothetical protein